MTVYNVSRAWKPENGKVYGVVEVRMNEDFERDDQAFWGIVNAGSCDRTTSFDLLRVVGAPNWHPRFDLMNNPPQQDKWRTHLGGGGGWTALAGIHAQKSKLRIKRLEVFGVPGCGLLYQSCPRLKVDTGLMDRVGWPLYGSYLPGSTGARIFSLTIRDHWMQKAWGDPSMQRGVSLRRFEPLGIGARGEIALAGADIELTNCTHQGDGIGWKISGTQVRVRGYQGGACWLGGVNPANPIQYPDPVLYRHLHEARDVFIEESVFSGLPFAGLQSRAVCYVSFPFTEPPIWKRCTFVKGRHLFAFQVNYAKVLYEDCEFVGWADQAAAFELSGPHSGMPAASIVTSNCRYYAS